MYTRYTAVLLRKTSRELLSLEPNGISHLHSIAHTAHPSTLVVGQQGIGEWTPSDVDNKKERGEEKTEKPDTP